MTKDRSDLVGPLVRRPQIEKVLEFTADQQSVLAHRGSPLVVIGGPGTGKTTVLVESALARINEGQDPNSILMLAYGRERASDLRDAVALRTTAIMNEPIARTFHSLAFSILKMNPSPHAPEPILMSGPEQEFFIRELLDGDIENGKKYWPPDLEKALTTRGFVRELRDLILRASARNLTPDQLRDLGEQHGEKYWPAASVFWRQYLGVLELESALAGDAKRRIDPSQIVIEAYHHLREHPGLATELRARFHTILVDEYQESDPAQRLLLSQLAQNDLVLFADPDSAVGRFRGADPDQLDAELEKYQNRGAKIILRTDFRSSNPIFDVAKTVVAGFRGASSHRERNCPATEGDEKPVVIGRFRSLSEEAQFIAYQFRHAHLIDGKAWSQMAVILRTPGAQASALRRAFAQSGIPVATEIGALANNAAIEPFLLLAQIALGMRHLSADNCERLLLSEFGGADSVSLRRIRRALVITRSEEDQRTGAELLIAAIDKGEFTIEGARPLEHIHDLLALARKAARRKSAQAEDLLWEIWSNAKSSDGSSLSDVWRRQALRGGLRGAAADRDLDAMMQLFESARRFAERFPYSSAESFIRQVSQETIQGDVITAQGQRPDVVEILTVHAAQGREWEIVAIAGLQEGVWPNLRPRGSLLGSERLVELLRHGNLPRKELETVAASGIVEDERRLIHVAITRAKFELIVTAVQKDEDEPSAYFEEIATAVLGDAELISTTKVPRPITPTALVSTLRGQLGGENSLAAGSLLKRLYKEGLELANPHNWAGTVSVSSTEPITPPNILVSVSPSGAEAFTECGLKWFLERSGGKNSDSTAQVLGSAIHAFAALMEEDKELTEADLVTKLRESWKLIDSNTGWMSALQLQRAELMIEKFVKYHRASLQEREIVGVEAEFDVAIGRAKIRGTVDRLEVTADGKYFVVDFKTGANAISKEDAQVNLQMQAYQLAANEGGFGEHRESAGAELVYLGSKTKEASIRRQPPIDVDAVRATINEIAEGMGKPEFLAMENERCAQCDLRNACPIRSEGRTVLE